MTNLETLPKIAELRAKLADGTISFQEYHNLLTAFYK